jgi:hypothetical protein
MMSAFNLKALVEAGYTYIDSSLLHKLPYDIAEYQKTSELRDQQTVAEKREDYRLSNSPIYTMQNPFSVA